MFTTTLEWAKKGLTRTNTLTPHHIRTDRWLMLIICCPANSLLDQGFMCTWWSVVLWFFCSANLAAHVLVGHRIGGSHFGCCVQHPPKLSRTMLAHFLGLLHLHCFQLIWQQQLLDGDWLANSQIGVVVTVSFASTWCLSLECMLLSIMIVDLHSNCSFELGHLLLLLNIATKIGSVRCTTDANRWHNPGGVQTNAQDNAVALKSEFSVDKLTPFPFNFCHRLGHPMNFHDCLQMHAMITNHSTSSDNENECAQWLGVIKSWGCVKPCSCPF